MTLSESMHIFSSYVPTFCSTANAKDAFYEKLDNSLGGIPAKEHLFELGNLKSGIDSDYINFCNQCIRRFSIKNLNENGPWLLELCF